MKKTKRPSGGAKLKAAGKHPILLGVSSEHLRTLREAAAKELRPVTQFVLFHAIVAAERAAEKVSTPAARGSEDFDAASSSTKAARKIGKPFTPKKPWTPCADENGSVSSVVITLPKREAVSNAKI